MEHLRWRCGRQTRSTSLNGSQPASRKTLNGVSNQINSIQSKLVW